MNESRKITIKFLSEVPELSNIIAKWYYDEWGTDNASMTLEAMHDIVQKKTANNDQLPLSLVIFVDDHIAGVAELKYRENKNFPEYTHWLGGIFVAPQYRGLGLASKLINKAKAVAEKLNVKQLYLQTEPKNIRLYEGHNFKQLHTADHMGIQTTIMVTNLTK